MDPKILKRLSQFFSEENWEKRDEFYDSLDRPILILDIQHQINKRIRIEKAKRILRKLFGYATEKFIYFELPIYVGHFHDEFPDKLERKLINRGIEVRFVKDDTDDWDVKIYGFKLPMA